MQYKCIYGVFQLTVLFWGSQTEGFYLLSLLPKPSFWMQLFSAKKKVPLRHKNLKVIMFTACFHLTKWLKTVIAGLNTPQLNA